MLLVLIPLVPALAMLYEYAGRNRVVATAVPEPAVEPAEKPVVV